MRKNIEEIKNELLESIAEERSENTDLVHKPENVLNLEDALVCVKQYEKHLQNEKWKVTNIVYNQGYILLKFKESEEFIDTLKSMPYFKNFDWQIKLICPKKILME